MAGIPPAQQGVLQIETPSISMPQHPNMSAADSPQAVHQITIVNEKGRSSQAEVDSTMQKADRFVLKASPTRPTIKARNGLRNYCSFCAHSEQGEAEG